MTTIERDPVTAAVEDRLSQVEADVVSLESYLSYLHKETVAAEGRLSRAQVRVQTLREFLEGRSR